MKTLHYFFGIENTELINGDLILTQSKYIHDSLTKTKMDTCKSIGSPMLSCPHLSTRDDNPYFNPSFYRSIMDALQNITLTCSDISFDVNKRCQFMPAPFDTH